MAQCTTELRIDVGAPCRAEFKDGGQTSPELLPQHNVLFEYLQSGKPVIEYLLRFIVGGVAVSAFAALGDMLRPKSFAGLFGSAPSIALATILITLAQKGAPFVAVEGRSMIAGAFALAAYSWTVCLLLQKFIMASRTATILALVVWFAVAFGLTSLLLGLR